MSDAESPSHKKRKVDESYQLDEDNEDNSDGGFIYDCFRCGYSHADDEEGELDCGRNIMAKVGYTNTEDWDSDNWVCQHIPFTEYLREYKPEKTVDKVDSFLVLGELCENLMIFTQTIESDGQSHHLQHYKDENDQFDFKLFENFRGKLKVIQDMSLKKAQEALEKWQRDGNANLVFKELFSGDWKEARSIGRMEKHEGEDKASLNKAYTKLSSIYVSLRDIKHGAYCDRHNNKMIYPDDGDVDVINKKMKEFKLEEFWVKI